TKKIDRYRLLVNNIKDYAIFLMDANGLVQTWNLGAELLKGFKADEIIGQSFERFYTREDIKRNHPTTELKLARKNGRYEEEGWRVRKDGTMFWANVIITTLIDETGHHVVFAKITRYLSEKRLAEQKLRASEERFRLLVENVKDYAIIMLSPTGHVVSWNEGAVRLKGYNAGDIIGKHFSDFYEREDVEIGKCEYELEEAEATGRFEDEGWRLRRDGTKFWANVVLTALRDSTGRLQGFANVTRDMTERKRAEEKLRMAHQSLEKRVLVRTHELETAIAARDEFLSIASRELRTPLAALKLQQQLLDRQLSKNQGMPLSHEQATSIALMTGRQVQQLTRLIDDMFDVSRIATGRLRLDQETSDLTSVGRRICENFAPQFKHAGIMFNCEIQERLDLHCDSQRIEQMVSNLIANAMKYGNGTPVVVTFKSEGTDIVIQVSDSGNGIEQQDQTRIFERFERADRSGSGLGLGLYITRQIAEAHGGAVTLESNSRQGTTFTVRLPTQRR
ncbi:MAG: PAS domain-containing sensor histidine kinase, partial [Bdellovibrionia bacterium]